MKVLDAFLSKLKTDRNTFFTYIFTLLTAYVLIDRFTELLFLWFTGVSTSFWGPIQYTLALACPVLAFMFSFPSKFAKSNNAKLSFFYVYCVALYVIGITMVVQWGNILCWKGLLSLPNYKIIFSEFSELILPAFTALAIYLPLITFYKLFLWLYKTINDPIFPNNFKESICDWQGVDISVSPIHSGQYSFEINLCKDRDTSKAVKILENRRFESTLIVGPSASGKSALVMEPMMAQDLEKKFFFRETSKEMGYAALKSGIAVLNKPYNKDYLNKNFNLNMLVPVSGKEKIYENYMNKLIYSKNPDGSFEYKNLGFCSVTPDAEQTRRVAEIAKNFDIPVNIIDPLDPNSIGLNPFIIGNPALCGLIISLVLRGLFGAQNTTVELAYMEDVALQSIQNVVMLLKVMFPKLNDGLMPNLEDLLRCLTDFSCVESMCEELKKDPELVNEYNLQITYFEENFYKNGPGAENMKRYIHFATGQLDVLLRSGQVRNIICNRFNNVDFRQSLMNGEVTLICTRPTDIGGPASGGFGRFFLFLMMCCVEGRPGTESSRIPHYLYVDDFDAYANPTLSDIFTVYRKFHVGTIFAINNLSRMGGSASPLMQALLSNCPTKLSFGNNTPEDYAWWEKEFGQRREWSRSSNYNKDDESYAQNLGNVSWDWKDHMKVAKIQGLKFKGCIYKTKDKYGKNVVNFGSVDFLASKYKEPQKIKVYNFDKYNSAISNVTEDNKPKKIKFDPKHISFSSSSTNVNPIQTDTTDSNYLFNNEDAISYEVKKKK